MSIHERRINSSIQELLVPVQVDLKTNQPGSIPLIPSGSERFTLNPAINSEKLPIPKDFKVMESKVEPVVGKIDRAAQYRFRKSGCQCRNNIYVSGCRSRRCEKRNVNKIGASRESANPEGSNNPGGLRRGSLRIVTGESRMGRIPQSSGSKREGSKAA